MTGDERLRRQLNLISPVDEREERSIAATLERLSRPHPYDQQLDDHHLTASAFVVSSRGMVLLRHRLLHIWVQPGGHVDADESPESAALRETLEETGLVARHFDPVELFHVDVHPGPKGHRGPPDHMHYDLRFAVLAPPLDPTPPPDESPEVAWFDFGDAQRRCEPALAPAIAKLARWYEARDVRD